VELRDRAIHPMSAPAILFCVQMRRLSAPAVVLALLLPARSAAAADWYVDASAPPGGNGSAAQPFQTNNDSLAGLSRGDTVWIATGTYGEIVDVANLPGSSGTTTFRAMQGATPVIDGTNGSSSAGYVVQTSVPDTTFQDLTIQNAVNGALGVQFYYADGGQVIDCVTKNMSSNAVTFYYSSQGTVSGCTLQGNVAGRKTTGTVVTQNEVYGASAEGIGLYDGSTQCTVSHNVIHDNYSVDLYLDSISHSVFDANFIYESSASNDLEGIEISDEYYSDLAAPVNSYNTITNNVIFGSNLGIVFWMSGEWPSTPLQNESGLRYDVISNNTVVNTKGALKWDASPAHVGTTIENNVFVAQAGVSPAYLLQANSAGGIALDHDLWYAPDLTQAFLWVGNQVDHTGYVSASGQGAGDVLADPAFAVGSSWTAPPPTSFELTMGSPAVGAGVTLSAVPDDFLGASRPSGHCDIGAFQYGATVPADGGGSVTPSPEGGAAADSGADASGPYAGADAGAAHDAGASGGSSKSSGGCGCRDAGAGTNGPAALGLVGLLFLAVRRRR
jgi:MYXO-CTERM domain-containing protein